MSVLTFVRWFVCFFFSSFFRSYLFGALNARGINPFKFINGFTSCICLEIHTHIMCAQKRVLSFINFKISVKTNFNIVESTIIAATTWKKNHNKYKSSDINVDAFNFRILSTIWHNNSNRKKAANKMNIYLSLSLFLGGFAWFTCVRSSPCWIHFDVESSA